MTPQSWTDMIRYDIKDVVKLLLVNLLGGYRIGQSRNWESKGY